MIAFGLGELGLLLVLALVFLDAKEVARAMRWFRTLKSKLYRAQSDLRQQLDSLLEDQEPSIAAFQHSAQAQQSKLRDWGIQQAKSLGEEERERAGQSLVEQLVQTPLYRDHRVFAAFIGGGHEIPTRRLLERMVSDGKTLMTPWIDGDVLRFARVDDLNADLAPGRFGIPEPVARLRTQTQPPAQVCLVPGTCFDWLGGRIGRGKGFYDRYLQSREVIRVGVSFHVQITSKKLDLKPGDQRMEYLLTEKEFKPAVVPSS